jgi:hypothetical protein
MADCLGLAGDVKEVNSHDRRTARRIGKVVDEAVSKAISQQMRPTDEHRSWLIDCFRIAPTKLISGFLMLLALVGGYAVLRPNVTVEPEEEFNPNDPFSTRFTIKNENLIMSLNDVFFSCKVTASRMHNNRWQVERPVFLAPPRTVPALAPLERTTIDSCNFSVSAAKNADVGKVYVEARNFNDSPAKSSDVEEIYVETEIGYKVGWHLYGHQEHSLKGIIDSSGKLHWSHIAEAELRDALARANIPYMEAGRPSAKAR